MRSSMGVRALSRGGGRTGCKGGRNTRRGMGRSAYYCLGMPSRGSRRSPSCERPINDSKRARAGCGRPQVRRSSERRKSNPGHIIKRRARRIGCRRRPAGPLYRKGRLERSRPNAAARYLGLLPLRGHKTPIRVVSMALDLRFPSLSGLEKRVVTV
jgi:hypothetical protein